MLMELFANIVKAVNFFDKQLHFRCFTGFGIGH